MTTAAIVITWGGYALASWGYCLFRGYNITFLQWVDPLQPFSWGSVGTIPATQVWPTGAAATAATD